MLNYSVAELRIKKNGKEDKDKKSQPEYMPKTITVTEVADRTVLKEQGITKLAKIANKAEKADKNNKERLSLWKSQINVTGKYGKYIETFYVPVSEKKGKFTAQKLIESPIQPVSYFDSEAQAMAKKLVQDYYNSLKQQKVRTDLFVANAKVQNELNHEKDEVSIADIDTKAIQAVDVQNVTASSDGKTVTATRTVYLSEDRQTYNEGSVVFTISKDANDLSKFKIASSSKKELKLHEPVDNTITIDCSAAENTIKQYYDNVQNYITTKDAGTAAVILNLCESEGTTIQVSSLSKGIKEYTIVQYLNRIAKVVDKDGTITMSGIECKQENGNAILNVNQVFKSASYSDETTKKIVVGNNNGRYVIKNITVVETKTCKSKQ